MVNKDLSSITEHEFVTLKQAAERNLTNSITDQKRSYKWFYSSEFTVIEVEDGKHGAILDDFISQHGFQLWQLSLLLKQK